MKLAACPAAEVATTFADMPYRQPIQQKIHGRSIGFGAIAEAAPH
jgi:hypothetical protein